MSPAVPGIVLENATQISHGAGSTIKTPFSHLNIPVTMHELSPGSPSRSFAGQFGFIHFDTSVRLPRHVHIAPVAGPEAEKQAQHFTAERILVLNGVALVELNGGIFVIPPGALVTIAAGVPHTWTSCPAGVRVGDVFGDVSSDSGTEEVPLPVSDGTFLMVYEYEEVTGFFPTEQTETLGKAEEYVRCEDLERIRFPELSVEEVLRRAWFVWGKEVRRGKGV